MQHHHRKIEGAYSLALAAVVGAVAALVVAVLQRRYPETY
jgi:hypothetical protein